MTWSDYKVERPSTPQPRGQDLTLRDFGWAEGGYTIPCIDCPKDQQFADQSWGAKRSWRCKKHAQAALDAHNAKEQVDG